MNILIKESERELSQVETSEIFDSIIENLGLSKIFIESKRIKVPKKFKNNLCAYTKTKDYDAVINFKFNDGTKIDAEKTKLNFFFDLSNPFWKNRLRALDVKSYKYLDKNQNSNVFNLLGPINTDEIYYFPYGYSFRCTGLGEIDNYGFRIKKKKNIKSDFKICLLGGSACWGFNNLYSKTFGNLLEKKLNNFLKKKNINVQIYNFAQHSHVVIDEIMTFILHIQKLKPDIVIIHDGFNDLLFGMLTDYSMLKNKITYGITHEYFANSMSQTGEKFLTQKEYFFKCVNNPDDVINSYYSRKIQLITLINNLKIKTISSLQPFILSKNYQSDEEKLLLNDNQNSYKEAYRNLKYLYDKVSTERKIPIDIDFHDKFRSIKDHAFIDFCHTNDRGEEIISEFYFNYIVNNYENIFKKST